MRRKLAQIVALGFALSGLNSPAHAAETKTADLAEAAQNPIASMISLPFQNNTYFGIAPDNITANSLLIQPVYPISLGKNWNVIARAIVLELVLVEPNGGIRCRAVGHPSFLGAQRCQKGNHKEPPREVSLTVGLVTRGTWGDSSGGVEGKAVVADSTRVPGELLN